MKLTTLEQTLFSMWQENTGASFLDSGGAYGRNWQRNQKLTIEDLNKKPSGIIEISYSERWGIEIYAYNSMWHHLNATLELDDICIEFNNMPVDDWESDLAYGLSKAGEEFLLASGAEFENPWNTYNWENNFDEILQGCNLDIDGESYVLIQYHGGCDVRGGYTDAKLFKISDWYKDYFLYHDTVYGPYFEELNEGFDVSSGNGVVTQSTGYQSISDDFKEFIKNHYNLSEENDSITIKAFANEF